MKHLTIFLIFLVIVISACTSGEKLEENEAELGLGNLSTSESIPAKPTETLEPTTEPSLCDEVEGTCLYLNWDGENCDYTGPSEIDAGPVTFIFNNESESSIGTNLARLHEGKTVQDIIDYTAEVNPHAPSWVTHTGAYNGFVSPGRSHSWSGQLELGIHFFVCLMGGDDYFGGALTVID